MQPPILWHGLVRACRDFDDLAAALPDTYSITCPEMIGRGLSQWSPDPDTEYCLAFYAQIARDLADQLGLERLRAHRWAAPSASWLWQPGSGIASVTS